jgi:hypothetical protein
VADFYNRYPSCHLHEFKMHPRVTAALQAHPKGLPPFFGKTPASDFWSLVSANTVAPSESLLLRDHHHRHAPAAPGDDDEQGAETPPRRSRM